jgi:hypothetical protein
MKSSWGLLLVVVAVALAAALAYVAGQSAAQLRGLLSSTSAAASIGASRGAEAGQVPEPTAATIAPPARERAGSVAGDDAPEETGADAGFEEPSSASTGPPTGEEFARLLEEGLIERADPEAVEAYLRVLREQRAAPE